MMQSFLAHHREVILKELSFISKEEVSKDILIVVHDQLDYLKGCVDSIRKHTKNYCLYIWDNASKPDMVAYLEGLKAELPGQVVVVRSEENIGFIKPNNALAEMGTGDYVILLNSDTAVFDGWDRAMIGWLQSHPDTGQVGYLGGLLNRSGEGGRADWGSKIDYIMGFCSCFSRALCRQLGLFDTDLIFAYCEDSDFSLRVQRAGYGIYALHLMLVHHFENKTIHAVTEEGLVDVYGNYARNHETLRAKWIDYLDHHRVDVRQGEGCPFREPPYCTHCSGHEHLCEG